MHSTFLLSCTAETLLFEQPVTNVFWPHIQLYQDGIVYVTFVSAYVTEYWVKAKVARFSISRLEFSLLYLPHTFDSFYTLPHQRYRPSSFSTERPLSKYFNLLNQNFTFTGNDTSKLKRGNRERTSVNSKKSAPDNGGHSVREGRRFYRTYHISVGFDRRTDILREVWYTCEWNMKALSLTVQKLWPRLKFLKSRSNFKVKVTRSIIMVWYERSCHKEYTWNMKALPLTVH